ncbi:MAG: formate dehydrogenase subunit alpha [Gammaproteobacteria bacterium]|nr:formate dehydrogenase subunit alpha [Gammaproteobacteria bacterium]
MSKTIRFTLNGKNIEAFEGETIWQAADRENIRIPHLCHLPQPDYRPDGNCRACVVEIEGERVLAASCLRKPVEGMVAWSDSERARKSQSLVMELLLADQPSRENAHERDSRLWKWAETLNTISSRFPARDHIERDLSHPAMHVALDACIQCNLCVRACREVQVNDVIGMANRGRHAKIVFDFDDPMGASTCVACGECVQACPTGALMESTRVDANGIDKTPDLTEVDSVCPYCGVGCQITYQTHNNEIIAVQGRNGPSNRNRLCVKGRFGFDYVRHPHRLTKPLIRLDNATKSVDDTVDAADYLSHFREAGWDEALDYAANGLKQIRDEHGSSAMAGFGSAKCSNEEAYIFQKLVRAGFGTNNVDHCTRLCHASSVAALLEGIGSGAVSAPFMAAEESDCIILIGANPTSNHPVAATFFKQAAKKGTTLILMDPRKTQLQRYAAHTLQFKPGTDVAMLNAILNTIVEEELYDKEYVSQHTEGFDSLCRHIREFSPENMQNVCGIDAETLRVVARKYATSKASIIFWGMGISQHVHGTDNARCLIALSLITGQIGRPGTGLHPLRGQNNVQGASDAGLIPMMYPDYQPVFEENPKARFEDAWGTSLDPDKGLTVVEIMRAIHEGQIRSMYIMGENPAMSDPDARHAREALASLQHLVVQDIFLTETAFHADVILPASAWPEKDGTVTNTNRQIQMGRQALQLPGEARPDWWITTEIGKRIGMGWDYRSSSDIYQEMASVMPSLNNISWERIENEGSVTYPCDAPDRPGNDIVFEDGFPTQSGKGKIVPAGIISPNELPDEDFPMILSTGRQLEHWHTGAMTRRASVLDSIEPEAVATLSSQTLQKLNVVPGERIQVSTRRGSIELVARMDEAVPEDMVFVPFCYVEAAANILTNPALDPIGKIPEFKFCAARVSAA